MGSYCKSRIKAQRWMMSQKESLIGELQRVPGELVIRQGHGHFLRAWLLAAFLGVVGAVPIMAAPLQLPPIVEPASQEHHAGKLIFVELVTPDLAAPKLFYAGLFGWTF